MAARYPLLAGFIGILTISTAIAESGNLKHPDWHPNGRHLISEGSCTGNVGLYLLDTQDNSVRLLLDGDYTEGYPRWFADGKRIAFHQFDGRRNSTIHLASVTLDGEISDISAVTEGPYDIEPAPSPDGEQLVYSAKGEYGQDIAWLEFARGRPKIWASKYAENFPSWHPDGVSIIFQATIDEKTHIYRRLLSTYEISKLTETGSPNTTGHVSADAKRLVFSSERDDDREIYIRNLGGGQDERLTHRPGRDGYPKFSPDGERIAYHSVIEGANTVVRILNLDSKEQTDFSCENLPD